MQLWKQILKKIFYSWPLEVIFYQEIKKKKSKKKLICNV